MYRCLSSRVDFQGSSMGRKKGGQSYKKRKPLTGIRERSAAETHLVDSNEIKISALESARTHDPVSLCKRKSHVDCSTVPAFVCSPSVGDLVIANDLLL